MKKSYSKIIFCFSIVYFINLTLVLCLEFLTAHNDLMIWMFILMFACINFPFGIFQFIYYKKNISFYKEAEKRYAEIGVKAIGFWNYAFRFLFVGNKLRGEVIRGMIPIFSLIWMPFKSALIIVAFPIWFWLKFISTNNFYKFIKNRNLEEYIAKENK